LCAKGQKARNNFFWGGIPLKGRKKQSRKRGKLKREFDRPRVVTRIERGILISTVFRPPRGKKAWKKSMRLRRRCRHI